jgi:hypothetical protein
MIYNNVRLTIQKAWHIKNIIMSKRGTRYEVWYKVYLMSIKCESIKNVKMEKGLTLALD